MFTNKLALDQTKKELLASGQLFKTFFTHGTLEVELYKPNQVDLQTPHSRDEVYIIASGSGQFELEGALTTVQTGDFLFVAAGKDHRFRNFTEDFCTWVLFYGPEGGES